MTVTMKGSLDKLSVLLSKAKLHSWIIYLGKLAPRAVVVQLMGGLGNQMFQYAAGRHLSRKLMATLFLDVSWLSTPFARTKKRPRFHLDQYCIKGHILNPDSIIPVDCEVNTDDIVKDLIRNINVISEQETDLQNVSRVDCVQYLKGFWQSDIYFTGSSNIIKKELVPRDTSRISELEKEIISGNSIGIHVRRGDYLQYQDRFPVLPLSYYDSVLREFHGDHEYYIFSDDPAWCRNHWQGREYKVVEGNAPVEDLYLLSCCKHIVIANSSFSWWAAWLNDNGGKRVIAPYDWKGPGYEALRKGHEVLPSHWERIEYN